MGAGDENGGERTHWVVLRFISTLVQKRKCIIMQRTNCNTWIHAGLQRKVQYITCEFDYIHIYVYDLCAYKPICLIKSTRTVHGIHV